MQNQSHQLPEFLYLKWGLLTGPRIVHHWGSVFNGATAIIRYNCFLMTVSRLACGKVDDMKISLEPASRCYILSVVPGISLQGVRGQERVRGQGQ